MPPLARGWPGSALPLAGALLLALAVAQVLLSPPRAELADLLLYFLVSGALTITAALLAMRAVERAHILSLRHRALVLAAIGPAVTVVNIFVVAQLMFVSTGHDLQLLVALIVFGGFVGVLVASWSAAATNQRVDEIAGALHRLARESGGGVPALTTRGDEIDHLAGTVDVLAQRLAAAERERAALDAERRDLTGAISHDLRTPLASIRAMIEALNDGVVPAGDEVERYHVAIGRETERLSRMVDDLLELARIDSGALGLNRQPIAVHEIAAEVVDGMQPLARSAGIRLQLDAPRPLPAIPLDGARIERAIANLVRNAIEHSPAGGSIVVSAGQADDCAYVTVADDGPGIAPGDLPHIWTRFHRGDRARSRGASGSAGAGMGLAIVRGFVEAHGGSVDVQSRPGEGAAFTIRLPVARGSDAAAHRP